MDCVRLVGGVFLFVYEDIDRWLVYCSMIWIMFSFLLSSI